MQIVIICSPMSQPDLPRPLVRPTTQLFPLRDTSCSESTDLFLLRCDPRFRTSSSLAFALGRPGPLRRHRRRSGIWWLRAPDSPEIRTAAPSKRPERPAAATPTAALVAALQLGRPNHYSHSRPKPTQQPTATPMPTETAVPPRPPRPAPRGTRWSPAIRWPPSPRSTAPSIKDIISANSLSADGRLSIGQELLIPVAGPSGGPGPTATPGTTGLMYNVQAGDTISRIASRLQVAARLDHAGEQHQGRRRRSRIGQPLLIPLVPATPTPTPTVPTHPVSPTATPIPGLAAPQLLTPGDAATISGEDSRVAQLDIGWGVGGRRVVCGDAQVAGEGDPDRHLVDQEHLLAVARRTTGPRAAPAGTMSGACRCAGAGGQARRCHQPFERNPAFHLALAAASAVGPTHRTGLDCLRGRRIRRSPGS